MKAAILDTGGGGGGGVASTNGGSGSASIFDRRTSKDKSTLIQPKFSSSPGPRQQERRPSASSMSDAAGVPGTPKAARRPVRPEWAEPTVTIDEVALVKVKAGSAGTHILLASSQIGF